MNTADIDVSAGSETTAVQEPRALAVFLAIAFSWSWGWFAISRAMPDLLPHGSLLAFLFMVGPAVAAWICIRLVERKPLSSIGWRGARWHWFALAWLALVIFTACHLAVAVLLPDVSWNWSEQSLAQHLLKDLPADQQTQGREQIARLGGWLPLVLLAQFLLSALILSFTVNMVAGLGEELGWRGYLMTWVARFGFWRGSWLIGAVWGIWHAPMILAGHNYPSAPVLGVALMVVFCMLLSPPLSWLSIRSGSVFVPAVAHAALNSLSGLLLFVQGGTDLILGPTGLAGLVVLAVLNGALWMFQKQPSRTAW